MSEIELLKIGNDRMIELKEEYTTRELADAGFLGGLSRIWRHMKETNPDGSPKLSKQILKYEDRAFIGGTNKKRVILKRHIKEFIKANKK